VVKPTASATPTGYTPVTQGEKPKDMGGWFTSLFKNTLSLPAAFIAAGIGLLILIILISLILAATRRRKQTAPVVPNKQQTATYERSLQQRITELQANRQGTPAEKPSVTLETPAAPVRQAPPEVSASSTPVTPPPSTRQSTAPSTAPTNAPSSESQDKPMSVLERMKQKGITTPGSQQ
jgi:hypothetical protein